jgi:SAM-dependent methyltransferase
MESPQGARAKGTSGLSSASDRDDVLDRIRATYAGYRTGGRDRIWDSRNRGFARMTRDRNAAVVELVVRSAPDGGSVLDVGCGPGDLADLVRARRDDIRWTGIDLMADAVAEATRFRPWAEWVEGSVDAMPFPSAAFDVVVAATIFSSLPTVELEEGAAREITRVLRPGGWLVWYDLRYDNPRNPAVHGIPKDHLDRFFPRWHGGFRSLTLFPPLARRLGVLTGSLYPVLHLLAPLRSHLVGRLRKPVDTGSHSAIGSQLPS